MNWSLNAWNNISGIYQSIIEMPFIRELAEGSLDAEKFRFYIAQDAHYLEHFSKSLALLSARLPDTEDALRFIRFAEGAIVVEKSLHDSYFKQFSVSNKGQMEPACHHYTHFLKSTSVLDPVETGVAAVLPCFWIYREVGKYIYTHQQTEKNPYQLWIETYAGNDFDNLVNDAIAICDRMASKTTSDTREQMLLAFKTASKLEYDFWQAAWDQRKW